MVIMIVETAVMSAIAPGHVIMEEHAVEVGQSIFAVSTKCTVF